MHITHLESNDFQFYTISSFETYLQIFNNWIIEDKLASGGQIESTESKSELLYSLTKKILNATT